MHGGIASQAISELSLAYSVASWLFSCTGEEGDRFEGDIRLRPGEDPYDILHSYSYRRRVVKRKIMRDSVQDNSDNSPPGDGVHSSRLWPNNIVPFKYKDDLGEHMFALTFTM